MELTNFVAALVRLKNASSEIAFTCMIRKTASIFRAHSKQTSKNKNLLLTKLSRKT
jgi:hypothetical protein